MPRQTESLTERGTKTMTRPIIAVDFDGTIVDHRYPQIGKLKKGVKEALTELIKRNDIVIYSCRNNSTVDPTCQTMRNMVLFLAQNKIPYTKIDLGLHGKVVADLYIDDKAIRFEDNWDKLGLIKLE